MKPIPTTILITNTISKEVTEKDFPSKLQAKKYLNKMYHYQRVYTNNETYHYK